ncbi:unnamed protein product [Effrenium voratum]|uniref:Transmembrane protein n=1 Tax=Effrenium voratum TaxID=2562239 RepID=A0AA36I8L5_9DINO|nr:unnamed protein product [Effrenium voratum]
MAMMAVRWGSWTCTFVGKAARLWGRARCIWPASRARIGRPPRRDGHPSHAKRRWRLLLTPDILVPCTQISYFWFPVRIVHGQKRDWHFALLSCGDVEQANLELTVEATEGALSVFQASTSFDESSCPVAPSWLEKASSETVFWGLMVGVALCGSCCVLLVLLGGAWRSRQKPSMKWQQDSELVIGKPCSDAPHADVVEGKTKKSDDLVKAQPEEVDETMPV